VIVFRGFLASRLARNATVAALVGVMSPVVPACSCQTADCDVVQLAITVSSDSGVTDFELCNGDVCGPRIHVDVPPAQLLATFRRSPPAGIGKVTLSVFGAHGRIVASETFAPVYPKSGCCSGDAEVIVDRTGIDVIGD
jgi:hypothetical protein